MLFINLNISVAQDDFLRSKKHVIPKEDLISGIDSVAYTPWSLKSKKINLFCNYMLGVCIQSRINIITQKEKIL